jgi:hypothetical protein
MRAIHCRVVLLCSVSLMGFSGCAAAQPLGQVTKPGLYQLKLANDITLCRSMQDFINTYIDPEGTISFSAQPSFIKWAVVKGTEKALRDPAPGDVFETVVDVDNDGTPDHVFKGIMSIGGLNVDYLFVFSAERAEAMRKTGVDDAQLFGAEREINFVDVLKWIKRAQQEYGNEWGTWVPGSLPALEVFRHHTQTYVFGYNPLAYRDQSADAYVFQLLPNNGIRDVCMLHRVCPCGGCPDLKGQKDQRLPSPQWCKK